MLLRAYRASTACIHGHAKKNMWPWIIGTTPVSVILLAMNLAAPGANGWGHVVGMMGMVVGTLVMVKSQDGFVPAEPPPELPE
jgi:hypothetical protein